LKNILNRKISITGLGYVGLPVAVAFGEKSSVIGFDINEQRIAELLNGKDSTCEVNPKDLKAAKIIFTSKSEDLVKYDFHIIAVPTPITNAKQPDLGPLLNATEAIGGILKPGDIVVYESTVYPGCTEEDCVPVLERVSGLKLNEDFSVGYSPERINPGDREHTFTNIKKIVSGSSPEVVKIIAKVYGSVVEAGVHIALSIKVAEAAKVIENSQRDINIAFVNELAVIFNHLGIDTNEVLEAAETKWNFLPFRPGLVGGHCIGVDPYYLTHRAEQAGYHPQVILAGRNINDNMGDFVAQQTVKTMASAGIGAVGSKVIVLGLTFKEDCPDIRNSRVPDIISELKRYGCEVLVHDPYCDTQVIHEEYGLKVCELETLEPAHAVVLAVAHKQYREWTMNNWKLLLLPNGIVADVKNVAPAEELTKINISVWRL
jgi:UDP-N-acetyl-D-galactosamine dehydrogenase